MKSKGIWLLGLGLACVACCAAPFIGGAAAAAGGGALGAGWTAWILAIGLLAAGFYAFRARRSAPACAVATTGCGCGRTKVSAIPAEKSVIACTLSGDDFAQRTAWIRGLAKEHLLDVKRMPFSIQLTYAGSARSKIAELVAKERQCCAFLDFNVREAPAGIALTITAPEEARETAHFLFDHFAPETVLGGTHQKEIL